MNKNIIIKLTFVIGIVTIITGAYLKILHRANADTFFIIGIIATILFTIIGLYEIHSSNRIERSEKLLWTIGFLCMNTVAGIVYLLVGRKRILNVDDIKP